MNSIIFIADGRDFHAIDWYRTIVKICINRKVYLATDVVNAEGREVLLNSSDNIINMFNIDRWLFRKQSANGNVWRNCIKLFFFPIQVACLKKIAKQYPHGIFHAHTMYYLFIAWLSGIEYIGSPLQLSFGEAFQDKHIIAFDCDDAKIKYITNNFSPKHLVLRADEIDKYDLSKNFVRVIVESLSGADLIDMRKEISKDKDLGSLEIRQQKRSIEKQLIDDAKSILFKEEEMIDQYVDLVGTNGLDREKLVKIGKLICEQEIK